MNYLLATSSSSSSDDDLPAAVRNRKTYRKREDCLNKYNDIEFFERFRLTKPTVTALLGQIEDSISRPTNKGGCIQPILQLLLTLRSFATGNMLLCAADFVGVSKASASRIIKRVSEAIASMSHNYIKMYENPDEMGRAAEEFYNIARFPRVIGALDCTLIKIQSPGGPDAEIFRSRKGFFALNVQTISDANLRIRNVVARWPGSCHDQTIFNNSNVKHAFANGRYGRYLLLGDSGYSVERYLMTPLQHTETAPENLYNESHIRTRNVVERQYGVWKRRYPILSTGIKVNLDTARNTIVATAVLHNIALDMIENIPENWHDIAIDVDDNARQNNINGNEGRNMRRLIIHEHFATL